jgi:hypothetical protein
MSDTLTAFIASRDGPRWTVRTLWDWYGSIILSQSEPLNFILIAFHSTHTERKSGTTRIFSWDSKQKDFVLSEAENTITPKLEADLLSIGRANSDALFYQTHGSSKLSDSLVEAFLEDAYRGAILSALEGEQRIELWRWLSAHGLTVYRKLFDPVADAHGFEKVRFPPKIDFLVANSGAMPFGFRSSSQPTV